MPDVTGLVEAMSVMVACKEAYLAMEGKEIKAYFIDSKGKPLELVRGIIKLLQINKGTRRKIFRLFSPPTTQMKQVRGQMPYCGKIIIPNNVTDITSSRPLVAPARKKFKNIIF